MPRAARRTARRSARPVGVAVGDGEVQLVIPVEVADDDEVGANSTCEWPEPDVLRRARQADAMPQQNRDGVVARIRDDEVRIAILVEIGDRHGTGILTHLERGALRISARASAKYGSVAQDQSYSALDLVCDGEIGGRSG